MVSPTRQHSASRQPAYLLLLLCCLALLTLGGAAQAAPSGLPFTEDFASQALQDPALTNANWSTDEQALVLAWRNSRFGAFGPDVEGSDVSSDSLSTHALALGDVDGDGDLDLIIPGMG